MALIFFFLSYGLFPNRPSLRCRGSSDGGGVEAESRCRGHRIFCEQMCYYVSIFEYVVREGYELRAQRDVAQHVISGRAVSGH